MNPIEKKFALYFLNVYVCGIAVLVLLRASALTDFVISTPLMIPMYVAFLRGYILRGVSWLFAGLTLAAIICSKLQ